MLPIALSVSKPTRSFYDAGGSAAASVLGGILGWMIGSFLWQAAEGFVFSIPGITREAFTHVQGLDLDNAFLALLTAAFTPIPFKVFTIASSVFEVLLATLVVESAIGRSGRFFRVATAIHALGPTIRSVLDRYLEGITIAMLALLVAGFYAVRYLF